MLGPNMLTLALRLLPWRPTTIGFPLYLPCTIKTPLKNCLRRQGLAVTPNCLRNAPTRRRPLLTNSIRFVLERFAMIDNTGRLNVAFVWCVRFLTLPTGKPVSRDICRLMAVLTLVPVRLSARVTAFGSTRRCILVSVASAILTSAVRSTDNTNHVSSTGSVNVLSSVWPALVTIRQVQS